MRPNMIDAEINGLILWHGEACAVRLERCLLMLDAVSWARWIAGKKREEAMRCERDGGIRSLAEVNQQIREIERWLVTGKGLCKTTYVLYRRQLFAAPVVMFENCEMYVRRLLCLKAESATVPSAEFVLDMDVRPPILYVMEDMSAAAQHTGPYIQGRVVDRREMLKIVRNGIRDASRQYLHAYVGK